jgi:hypothetical protein
MEHPVKTALLLLFVSSSAAAQTAECSTGSCNLKGRINAAVVATIEKQPKREGLMVFLAGDATDADVTAISHLTWLRGVGVSGKVTTLAPLASLTHLRRFGLTADKVTTLAPLAKLTELENVSLNQAKVSDIAALKGMTKLTSLDLQYNPITDVSVLAGLKALQNLILSGVHATDWKALAGHPELKTVWLNGTSFADANLLEASTKLEELVASDCELKHVRPLARMTEFGKLGLARNPQLSDLSPLAKLTNLREVDVSHTAVRDLSPLLASAKSLTEIKAPKGVRPASVAALKKQNPELQIELDDE